MTTAQLPSLPAAAPASPVKRKPSVVDRLVWESRRDSGVTLAAEREPSKCVRCAPVKETAEAGSQGPETMEGSTTVSWQWRSAAVRGRESRRSDRFNRTSRRGNLTRSLTPPTTNVKPAVATKPTAYRETRTRRRRSMVPMGPPRPRTRPERTICPPRSRLRLRRQGPRGRAVLRTRDCKSTTMDSSGRTKTCRPRPTGMPTIGAARYEGGEVLWAPRRARTSVGPWNL